MNVSKKHFQKGSFTIEAVIWIPLVLCMMLSVLQEGIQFYRESEQREFLEEVTTWDGVSRFYELWMIKELGEEWKRE